MKLVNTIFTTLALKTLLVFANSAPTSSLPDDIPINVPGENWELDFYNYTFAAPAPSPQATP